MLSVERIDPVTGSLKQFWELESIGNVDKGDAHMFLEEEESDRQFNKVLKFDGERYEVPLLWKGAAPPLRSNYFQAVDRLESVERQLKENPEKANAYKDASNQYVKKGYAVEVKDGDKKVSYLPHHEVSQEDKKTTKFRVVFDALAYDEHEVSLNDCILSGPGFNLILYQSYFDSEHVGSHLWLTLRRCSSRSKLTKETTTLYDIYEGIYRATIHRESTSCRDWHLLVIVVHSWPLPQFKVTRQNAENNFLMHQ